MKKLLIAVALIMTANSYAYRTQDMHYEFSTNARNKQQLNDLKQQRADLTKKMETMIPGTTEYKRAQTDFDNLEQQIKNLT